MAITLGTFTKLDDGVFTGMLKTLNVTAALTIVPVDKMSDNAPDSSGLCRPALRGRRRLEPGREVERRDLLNLKIGAPEFGPNWVRCRLVKLEHRPKTAPPTSPCGSRATANGDAPPRIRGGAFPHSSEFCREGV